jgi:RNA polymerase sigma-70 factor (ECF subfamily)
MLPEPSTEVPGIICDSLAAEPWVQRCRDGDGAAWRALYDAHFDFAWRTARRLGLPEADVEDAVQEAFEVVFHRLGDFQGGRFSTWLFRIVANVVEARSTLATVQAILQKLSREKREVFALHEVEGRTHEEIADLVDAKVETVRTRLFYARREFEQHARRMGVEP